MNPIGLVRRAIPERVPIKITEIFPRLKEGGAYVKFTYPEGMSAAEIEGMSLQSSRDIVVLTHYLQAN